MPGSPPLAAPGEPSAALPDDQVRDWARRGWGLAPPISVERVAAGVDNHNWKVGDASGSFWVLTEVLVIARHRLLWLGQVLAALDAAGLRCPVQRLPATGAKAPGGGLWLLAPWLPGQPVSEMPAEPGLAGAFGALVARMHLAGRDLPAPPRGSPPPHGSLAQLAERWMPRLAAAESAALDEVMGADPRLRASPLRRGVVHGDLFRDNVLVDAAATPEERLLVLDFYAARHDAWIYDLAVAALDWCWDEQSRRCRPEILYAMLKGYRSCVDLAQADLDALPAMLRRAAAELYLRRLARSQLRPLPAQRSVEEGAARWSAARALAAALEAGEAGEASA